MQELFSKFPTPYQILTDPVSISVYLIISGLFLYEAIFPARPLPSMKYWRIRGLLFFLVFILFTSYAPLLWDDFLSSYQLIDLSHLNLWIQTFMAIFLFELVQYGWHISMHKSNFFFRVSHQLHHSVERLDVSSAFMFSFNDMIGLSLISSLCFSLIMGLSPQAITNMIFFTTFLGVFQHANIHTPQWLGYIIQRPESHTVHHARGIHAYNYTDLPIIDILFGTFKNPKTFEHQTGYYDDASSRILDMLRGKDVTKPSQP
ncbi:Sterol desaturase/sphingolipid hydroxylase, fatty acid hydroxylase superfamily [Reichenbachiella faecimaris]|uniref:Sterol desaturase/sphingolipid hydroxylase, fatty acid hydroxylase superfamily n=1 Tax=Reichenbachiella faecimaris TaxID=692418 RepID=A0A1W2G6E8_REIFA|nr:sterol desaturase family protein [Reichenbachiella faecimaris]SMD32250.1 Sterol desaturase/sphingolipid hydroxylase, fatty acid hydroxylase superfamily [Reichenbachiella faecimaris]